MAYAEVSLANECCRRLFDALNEIDVDCWKMMVWLGIRRMLPIVIRIHKMIFTFDVADRRITREVGHKVCDAVFVRNIWFR